MAKCRVCCKGVRTEGILCTLCNTWVHLSCAKLTYSTVKHYSKEQVDNWQCQDCTLNEKGRHLRVNIEDDLKQKEEESEFVKNMYEGKLNDLELKTKSLEMRPEKEKEHNEMQVEQENVSPINKPDFFADKQCKQCIILMEESKNMISSIRSLETVISMLQKENTVLQSKVRDMEKLRSEQSCLTCFHPLKSQSNIRQGLTDRRPVNNWQVVNSTDRHSKTKVGLLTKADTSTLELKNRFSVLATDDDSVLSHDSVECGKVRDSRPHSNFDRSRRSSVGRTTVKPKVKLFADSQGRGIGKLLSDKSELSVTGDIKPGAKLQDIVPERIDNVGPEDYVVIMAGTNDVSRNEAKELMMTLRRRLEGLRQSSAKALVMAVPHRHDLPEWSCVNIEIKRVNMAIEKVCKFFKNCIFISLSDFGRRFFTAHGLHTNSLGKMFIADKIIEIISGDVLT
jgi:lysophospholipase L1-like esterase